MTAPLGRRDAAPRRPWWSYAALLLLTATLVALYLSYVWFTDPNQLTWSIAGHEIHFARPRWFGVFLALPWLIWVAFRSLADLPRAQLVLASLARFAFLLVLGVALARPFHTEKVDRIAAVVLVDVSDSISDASLQAARSTLDLLGSTKRPMDALRVVTFARRPKLAPQGTTTASAMVKRHASGPTDSPASGTPAAGASTNLQAALKLSYGLLPPGYLHRVLILSDGQQTEGNALSEAQRARRLGIRIDARPFDAPPPPELAVANLKLPAKVDVGQAFKIGATIYANHATRARLRLLQDGLPNGRGSVQDVNLVPGAQPFEFDSVVRVAGKVEYRLELESSSDDQFAQNNHYTALLDVPGRPSILYVEGQPRLATYFASALSAQQFDVDVRTATAFPTTIEELDRYDFVVLSDLAEKQLGYAAQGLLEHYLSQSGGGLLFAGGEQGFSLGGWERSPLAKLLPVRMESNRRREMPGVALGLVIDRSGSMTGLPIEMAKAACVATLDTLGPDDLVEVIAFDATPKRYVRAQPARYRTRIENDITRMQPGGGTEIFRALDMAYQDISALQARRKHVILLTDGQAPRDGITELVRAMMGESITVTAVGLGSGADGDLLRTIADAGGGRYHPVPDPSSLPRIFTKETELVTEQSAVEEWFPVHQVAPADFMRGLPVDSAPMLHGYVSTTLRPPPARLLLASDRGEPILARWRVGLGWSLAWTSDLRNLWATDWLSWQHYGRFWSQLVREHMRRERRRELKLDAEVVQGEIRVHVDAFTDDERFDRSLVSTLRIAGPDPSEPPTVLPMRQVAPGRYAATFRPQRYGPFLLEGEHRRLEEDGALGAAFASSASVAIPYPQEYASFEPDRDLMRQIADVGRGKYAADPAALFERGPTRVNARRGLWPPWVIAALGLLVVDLLLRRVRLFDRRFSANKG